MDEGFPHLVKLQHGRHAALDVRYRVFDHGIDDADVVLHVQNLLVPQGAVHAVVEKQREHQRRRKSPQQKQSGEPHAQAVDFFMEPLHRPFPFPMLILVYFTKNIK